MNPIGAIFRNTGKNSKLMALVASAAVVFLLLLYVRFLLVPQISGISEARSKLRNDTSLLKVALGDVAKIGLMKGVIEKYDKKLERYEKMLPADEGISDLLESLSDMAKLANMSIVGIVPVEQKGAGAESIVYKEIPIMITAKAGYHELGQFLSNLENSDRFIKVADMQIKSNPSTPGRHDVELLVVTYALRRR